MLHKRQYEFQGEQCRVEGCKGKPRSNRLCSKHLSRWYRLGQAEPQPTELCDMPGCSGVKRARGWCKRHWWNWRYSGDPLGRSHNGGSRISAEKLARYEAATPFVRADLRMAHTMRDHGRRDDVEFYLTQAASHGRPLTKLEQEYADGLRMLPNRERDTTVRMTEVSRLTAEGLSASQIAKRLGVTERTVVRYRARAQQQNGDDQ